MGQKGICEVRLHTRLNQAEIEKDDAENVDGQCDDRPMQELLVPLDGPVNNS